MNNRQYLLGYLADRPVINTHSHYHRTALPGQTDLACLLNNSYCSWVGGQLGEDPAERKTYLERMRHNSYFLYWEKSMRQLYHFTEPLSEGNWDSWSETVCLADRSDPLHDRRIFRDICHYRKSLLDSYWDPGDCAGDPELFAPSYRINMFLFGYHRDSVDHNGNSPWKCCDGFSPETLEDYVDQMARQIAAQKERGACALKCAAAWDRGLDFRPAGRMQALQAWGVPEERLDETAKKQFQDYIMDILCDLAAQLGLPVQVHTGMGILTRCGAMELHSLIQRHPDTKFALLHCSYPWTQDVCALAQTCPNVYPDLTWVPLLSPSAAVRLLVELLEVGTSDQVCWGCDTWTAQESFGSLLAARDVIAAALAEKIDCGHMTVQQAEELADRILWRNAEALYRL